MIMKRHTLYTSICASALFLACSLFFSACSDEELIESSNIAQTGEGIFFGTSIGNGKWEPDVIGRSVKENKQKPLVIECGDGFSITATVEDGIKLRNGELKPQSRGTQVTNAVDVKAFDVAAYKNVNGTYEHYFTETVTDGVNPGENRYWPSKGTVDFIATYPQGLFKNQFPDAEEYADGFSFSYTIKDNVEEQEDIMVACPKGLNNGDSGEAVPLQFQHLLAAVQFKVGNVVACDIRGITIEGAKIGTVSFTYDQTNSAWISSISNTSSSIYSFEFDSDDIEEVSGIELNGNENNTMLLLPAQTISANSVKITVSYDDLLDNSNDLVSKYVYLPTGVWAMGKTTSYSINISPEGVTIPTPPDQDAHYTMVHMPYDLSGLSNKVTNIQAYVELYDADGEKIEDEDQQVTLKFKDNLTLLQSLNYWTEYQVEEGGTTRTNVRGEQIIDLQRINGEQNPLVLFVPANVSNQDRYGILWVTGDFGTQKDMVIGGGYFVQKCPNWSYDEENKRFFGVERIEEEYPTIEGDNVIADDLHYPYGFSWNREVTYTNSSWGWRVIFSDAVESIINVTIDDETEINVTQEWTGSVSGYNNPGYYTLNNFVEYWVAYGTLGIGDNYLRRITLDYSAISNLNNVACNTDGHTNTVNLYNFTAGINVSDFETQLDDLRDNGLLTKTGGTTENKVTNDYAAYTAIKKNKFYEVVSTMTNNGTTTYIYNPKIENATIQWYLPSSAQAPYINDSGEFALNGSYWSSTAVKDNNTQAYYYTFSNGIYNNTAASNRITTDSYVGHKVRAVINWTGTNSPL